MWNKTFNKQSLTFIGSLLFLGVVVLLLGLLFTLKVVQRQETKPHTVRTVSVMHVKPRKEVIRVTTYGTAQPTSTVTLRATISGQVVEAKPLFSGKALRPGEIVFNIEETDLDLETERIALQLEGLSLRKRRDEAEEVLLNRSYETERELYSISQSALEQSQENLTIKEELHKKNTALFESESLSQREHLTSREARNSALLNLLQAKKDLTQRRDAVNQLIFQTTSNDIDLLDIEFEKQKLHVRLKEIEEDRKKSNVTVTFPAQVVEVLVHAGEEVQPGTPLATVRSSDEVEISLNLPDTYFRWLYAGDLLENPRGEAVKVTLVNRNFPKVFTGAHIKGIGERLNLPTRSLPIVIGRKNPLQDDGFPVPKEELKPGMYCRVELTLFELPRAYRIPMQALQEGNTLYYVTKEEGSEATYTVSKITDVELLHHVDDDLIVQLPEEFKELVVVTNKTSYVGIGSTVKIAEDKV